MVEYKISINKQFSHLFIIIDSFGKYTWAIPSKSQEESNNNTRFFKYPNNIKTITTQIRKR